MKLSALSRAPKCAGRWCCCLTDSRCSICSAASSRSCSPSRGRFGDRGVLRRPRRRRRRARRPHRARHRHRQPVRRGARLARRRHLVRPRAGDDHVLRRAQSRRLGLDLRLHFTACAVIRLARFNVEQAGRAKTHFHGLPSPAAGMTLATYYWFSQTPLYNETVISSRQCAGRSAVARHSALPHGRPRVPDDQRRAVPGGADDRLPLVARSSSARSIVVGSDPRCSSSCRSEFFFPALVAYVLFGAVKWAALGFLDRSSRPPVGIPRGRSRCRSNAR